MVQASYDLAEPIQDEFIDRRAWGMAALATAMSSCANPPTRAEMFECMSIKPKFETEVARKPARRR